MPNKNYDYLFKILIIGDYGVGKVDILQTILKDNTNQQPKGAGIDFAVKTVVIENKTIKLIVSSPGVELLLPFCAWLFWLR